MRNVAKPVRKAHSRKTGPAYVGAARLPYGMSAGRIAPLPIRRKTGMGVIAVLLGRGATMAEMERVNRERGSKSTVGQHIQHIRYRGYEIFENSAGGYKMRPAPQFVEGAHNSARPVQHPMRRRLLKSGRLYPDEVSKRTRYVEGAVRQVVVNAFERDPQARLACLKEHGTRCAACNLSFEERYGDRGKGFIHVHHKKPLARLRRAYTLDPAQDLVPVCPNCHAMLHRGRRVMEIAELRRIISS